MALTDEGNGVNVSMPVAPMTYGGGFGGFGNGDWSWIIILLLFGMFGGWGGNMGYGNDGLYPWLLNNNTQAGFDNVALSGQLSGIQNSITNGTIDSLNRSFDAQSSLANNLYGITSALQNCCCENRANIADLKYTVATENCADRAAVNDALKDVIAANTASTQRILDQMCADKIDAKNERIAELERKLTMATLASSQTMQTATLIADNAAQTRILAPTPIPAYVVPAPGAVATTTGS